MNRLQQAQQYIAALDTSKLLYATAALSIAASFIHGIVTPEHFEEWWGYGTFFMLAALGQLFYGLLLIFQPWQPDPDRDLKGFSVKYLYWAGIIGNGFLIALYIVTRTVGIPFFGPEAGEVEDFTLLSMVSKVAEALLIVGLWMLLRRSQDEKSIPQFSTVEQE
jgi:hypothetical protein